MSLHEWLSFVTCVGLITLTLLLLVRGSRNSMESPIILLCIDHFGWNFASMAYEMTGRLAWHWLDVTISPFAPPLALHVVAAFVGRGRAIAPLLRAFYVVATAISAASVSAFFASVAMSEWTFSSQWKFVCLLEYVPCLLIAFVLLIIHWRGAQGAERSSTRYICLALVIGGVLTTTELVDQASLGIPPLGNIGTLLATGLLAITISRLRMLGHGVPIAIAAFAGALSLLAVGGYVIVLRSSGSNASVIGLGFGTVTLALYAATRDLLASVRAARERDERFAALGRIADQMAHDLLNPLAALKGALEFAHEEERRANTQHRADTPNRDSRAPVPFLDVMLEQVNRLERAVSDYRRIGRVEPTCSRVQINDLVSEIANFYALSEKNIRVQSVLASGLPDCNADPHLLTRVLENLIRNAVDAMRVEGTLILRTGQRAAVFGPTWVTIAIEDTGTGIDMRELDRVAGDFYTTKPNGSGLGLSFARRVVRAHGGRFSLISKVNCGTTVRLEFRALTKSDRGTYAVG